MSRKIDAEAGTVKDPQTQRPEAAPGLAVDPPLRLPGSDAASDPRALKKALRAIAALEAKLEEQRITLGRLKIALLRKLVWPPGTPCSVSELSERMAAELRRMELEAIKERREANERV